ncbi:MAG: hypothetical protein ACK5LL_04595 [Suipraeoptans sp.]
MFGDKDPKARTCANQGLWITILSTAFGLIAWVLGWALTTFFGAELSSFTALFTSWSLSNWFLLLPQAALCQLAIIVSLFVPVNSICGFFRGMSSKRPHIVPFFGKMQLIRATAYDEVSQTEYEEEQK